jgi:azurin
MRRFVAPLSALALVVALTGCGKDESAPAAPAATEAEAPAAAPATDPNAPVTVIEVTGNDALQFSVNAFTVKAGSTVTVTFKNVGTQPKETMGHNFVLLKSGVDAAAFASRAMAAKDTDYIPAGDADVLAHTKVLGPGETEVLTIAVPSEPGEYPFLCSFPGHSAIMKGVMTVVQ